MSSIKKFIIILWCLTYGSVYTVMPLVRGLVKTGVVVAGTSTAAFYAEKMRFKRSLETKGTLAYKYKEAIEQKDWKITDKVLIDTIDKLFASAHQLGVILGQEEDLKKRIIELVKSGSMSNFVGTGKDFLVTFYIMLRVLRNENDLTSINVCAAHMHTLMKRQYGLGDNKINQKHLSDYLKACWLYKDYDMVEYLVPCVSAEKRSEVFSELLDSWIVENNAIALSSKDADIINILLNNGLKINDCWLQLWILEKIDQSPFEFLKMKMRK